MYGLREYYLTLRILATIAVLFQRFYIGPLGAAGGLCDGLILLVIWRAGALK